MEDECEECIHDWDTKQKYHFDLWIGPDNLVNGSLIIGCENCLTPGGDMQVIVEPQNGLQTNLTELFSVNNGCIVHPCAPCVDNRSKENLFLIYFTVCGNSCEIPQSATCEQLANMFILTYQRFVALNPSLDCSNNHVIQSGTSVCMGGPCGE
eukprot:TRINITY_DN2877_c0_g1_i1.p1 TRINITY_DN2877_c0_g1~~TRINITY_DN2877_c0_g1_i1.p1  ORF type:complete len:153 (-),score=30.07 TRINITY_DN2877_c0_g1_i1:280-738(-)